jgi:hypothetical protein
MIWPTGIWSSLTACGGTGIIQFRTRQKAAAGANSTCNEQPATEEQRRAVEAPSIIEAACDGPISRGRVVNFRARERVAAVKATCDQHPPIAKQCCGMAPAGNIHAAGRRPISGGRVVEFRACQYTVIRPSSYQHLAVGQQRRRVVLACRDEAAGRRPSSRRWSVQFRVGRNVSNTIVSRCHQHLPVGQQGRRVVTVTGSSGATGETPILRGWIVELRAVGEAT